MNFEIMFFGSESCSVCQIAKKYLDRNNVQYQFVDANADEMQDICDVFDVEDLPHIQLVHMDTGKNIEKWVWSDGIPPINLSSNDPFQELVNQIKNLTKE